MDFDWFPVSFRITRGKNLVSFICPRCPWFCHSLTLSHLHTKLIEQEGLFFVSGNRKQLHMLMECLDTSTAIPEGSRAVVGNIIKQCMYLFSFSSFGLQIPACTQWQKPFSDFWRQCLMQWSLDRCTEDVWHALSLNYYRGKRSRICPRRTSAHFCIWWHFFNKCSNILTRTAALCTLWVRFGRCCCCTLACN